MLKAGRRVKLIMGVFEPELLEHALGAGILRVMTGHQAARAEIVERVVHHGAGCFGGKPLTPVLGAELKTHFKRSGRQVVRAYSAATDVLSIGPAKQRPVLDTVPFLPLELGFQPFADAFFVERSADQRAHPWVAPEGHRERPILQTPGPEEEPSSRRREVQARPIAYGPDATEAFFAVRIAFHRRAAR